MGRIGHEYDFVMICPNKLSNVLPSYKSQASKQSDNSTERTWPCPAVAYKVYDEIYRGFALQEAEAFHTRPEPAKGESRRILDDRPTPNKTTAEVQGKIKQMTAVTMH